MIPAGTDHVLAGESPLLAEFNGGRAEIFSCDGSWNRLKYAEDDIHAVRLQVELLETLMLESGEKHEHI